MASVDPTSRYADQASVAVPMRDGTSKMMGVPRMVPARSARRSYQVRPGDRLDLLGLAATGDTTRWWVIADANPYFDATRLEQPGQTVVLPDV